MPIGIIINCLSVAIGGVIGALLSSKLPDRIRNNLTQIFGVCAMGMGVTAVIVLKNLPAVVFSVIMGTTIGLYFRFGERINGMLESLQKPLGSLMKTGSTPEEHDAYMNMFITVLVLFCASANGIYGALDAGMSGDHTMLISKSVLDLFTAMVFACNLGVMISLISIPQFCIFMAIFLLARVIGPLTTPEMIQDFRGCGGILLLATGLRVMNVKNFPLLDMVPALILVMPVSWIWANWVLPLL